MSPKEERAKRRRETWAMEAFAADGTLLATNGKSTTSPPPEGEGRIGDASGRFLEALAAVRELVFGKAAVSGRLDRSVVVRKSRPIGSAPVDE